MRTIVRSLMICGTVASLAATLGGCVTTDEMASMSPAEKARAESCNRTQVAGTLVGAPFGLMGAVTGFGISRLTNSDCQQKVVSEDEQPDDSIPAPQTSKRVAAR